MILSSRPLRCTNIISQNWFQNRRAREKKENNIREYEARQKLEKEKAVANGTNQSDSDRKSSAPFPETTQTSQLPTDHHSEQHTPLSTDDEHIASDQDEDIKSEDVSEDTRDYFGDYQGMTPRVTRDPQVFSSSLFPGENHFAPDSLQQSHMQYHGSAYLDQSAPASFVTPGTTEDAVTKSSSLDIASRRSRRPPPLSINGSRSYSAVPKTTADLAMRAEPGCAMRRVSSANGTVRITKTSATPRSPYLQRNNSPSRTGTGAPPTPDTPIVATMQDLNNHAAISSTYALNNKFSVLNQDPTLRTPPTTPGIMDGFFNVNSAYGMTVSDETLMTPSVGSYASEFEIPSATTTTSSYMGLLGNSTDYYWSDASTSGRSSPALNTNHVQYMNINAPTFGHVAS